VSLSSIPRSLRSTVYERDAGQCQYCHLRQVGQAALFHVDHIVPRSKSGATVIENLALQCPHCSLRKSSKTHGIDPHGGDETLLFHPLRHVWTEHFRLETDGSIVGVSPIGRTTVEALQMNAPIVRTARAIQVAIGLL
jgi:hypothetical protein